jgi:hypothetical protein
VPADKLQGHGYIGVDLQVELYGKVIEHTAGYRGQYQRILELKVPKCQRCGKNADWIAVDTSNCITYWCYADRPSRFDFNPPQFTYYSRLHSLQEFSRLLGIPVTNE